MGDSATICSSTVISPRRKWLILRGRCSSSAPDGVGPLTDRGRPYRAVGVDSVDLFVRSTCVDYKNSQFPITYVTTFGVVSQSASSRGKLLIGRSPVRNTVQCVCECVRVSCCYERRTWKLSSALSDGKVWSFIPPSPVEAHYQPVPVGDAERDPLWLERSWEYARVRWSQRKPWWRFAVILTCKSIVKLVYRAKD